MVGAKHANSRPKLGSTQRHHVLADVCCHYLSMLGRGIVQYPLHKIVAILVTRDINQRNSGPIQSAFTYAVEIAAQELAATNLQTLFHHFGRKLIGAVFGRISDDVVNGPATVRRCPVLANVLNAPIAKLAMSHDINVGKNFLDTGALIEYKEKRKQRNKTIRHQNQIIQSP